MTDKAITKKARKTKRPADSAGPPLWPGLVESIYYYRPFPFPGDHILTPTPILLAALTELIRRRADWIEKPRFEGLSEVWAAALAGELLDWLAGRSAEGSKYAQGALVELSGKAVDWHSWSLHQGHELTLMRARKTPTIPGRVSLNPEVTADCQAWLESIGQGSETPVPMKRSEKEKKRKRSVYGATHRLAAFLYEYMEGYRKNDIARALGIPSDHPEIPARVREILALPPLESQGEPWKAWHKVGLKIVNDFTQHDPASHEAFKREGLSSLMNLTGQGKHTLTRDMPPAWKALANEISSL